MDIAELHRRIDSWCKYKNQLLRICRECNVIDPGRIDKVIRDSEENLWLEYLLSNENKDINTLRNIFNEALKNRCL